ncbi:hypothetical protein CQW23_24650 [Capsicum baccatum]|uniref:5-methyltetrahydropteroyltriglutamate--homocysteine S-methyltransferase n=1 Tax=Capsicum baccatum TaxID=33114 RepID=A0A2G2VVD2_CAPBA|nr:hypothetical protein CQW23_24650 [Capsicum baccatum]
MKDLGPAKQIFGMQIVRGRKAKKLWLSQEKYIQKVLRRFNMDKAKVVSTPLAMHFKLSTKQCPSSDDAKEDMKKVPYASVVGSLMYAMVCTRSDIAHAVGKSILCGYTDSDMVGDVDTRKSTSGTVLDEEILGGTWLCLREREVIAELKACGASIIQFDEPKLVVKRGARRLEAFTKAYADLESSLSGINVLVKTYFADVTAESFKTLTSLKGVTGFGFDLVHGTKTLNLIKSSFPSGKYLFAGGTSGQMILLHLLLSCNLLRALLVVSTSCSLLHTAVDLINETKLDDEIKSWLAFAAQKVVEVNALAKALSGAKDEAFFCANAAAQASRKSSPRVTNEAVQKASAALQGPCSATNLIAELRAQQKLPDLDLHRRKYEANEISLDEYAHRMTQELKMFNISIVNLSTAVLQFLGISEEYVKAITEEIKKVVDLQEELDIDVLVHGEPERNDMVEYFAEQFSGFACTANGWVQFSGSQYVKPPIIYGDIALAIKDEVEDLEKAGIMVIQIDEPSLIDGLPLRKSERTFYLNWAVQCFRITNVGIQDTTQIHIHMYYEDFIDIIDSIIDIDADVIAIENSCSNKKHLSFVRERVKYGAGIGLGVYDIHSQRIPSTKEIAGRVNKMLAVLDSKILWAHPNCGLKTRKYTEVKLALQNMVSAAKAIRTQLASAK